MMLGMESIRRGLKMEDDAARRDTLAHHEVLYGKRGSLTDETDDMGHNMVLGDMKTEYHFHEEKGSEGPGALVRKRLSKFAKVAIATAVLGTVAGAGIGVPMLINALEKEPPVAEPVKPAEPVLLPGEIRDWKLGQPIVE